MESAYAPADVVPKVVTSDTAVLSAPGHVFWITAANSHATDTAAIELNDSLADGGTDRWAVVLDAVDGATGAVHAVFAPPIRCGTGIWVDITGGTVVVTVGYN